MDEPVYVLAHEVFFEHQRLGPVLARLGVIRAAPAEAARALRAGAKVLVFPGSDTDSLRPWSARREVRFGGHEGFARLARETGVPVVPVVNAGAHECLVVLTQGRRIAEALGMPRWARYRSFPVALVLPWGLCVGPMAYLPYRSLSSVRPREAPQNNRLVCADRVAGFPVPLLLQTGL